jgi:hypothetical protein
LRVLRASQSRHWHGADAWPRVKALTFAPAACPRIPGQAQALPHKTISLCLLQTGDRALWPHDGGPPLLGVPYTHLVRVWYGGGE